METELCVESGTMTLGRARTSMVSRLLKTSILELCKASVPQELTIEIDGIVCITIGDEEEQVVVKIHEKLVECPAVRQATSSSANNTSFCDHSASDEAQGENSSPEEGAAREGRRKQPQPHHISSNKRVSSTSSTTPNKRQCVRDAGLDLSTSGVSTSVTRLHEDDTGIPVEGPSLVQKFIGHASLSTALTKDFKCEYCTALMSTYEELRLHNEAVHGAHTCSYCWRSFMNQENFVLHLRTTHQVGDVGNVSKESEVPDQALRCDTTSPSPAMMGMKGVKSRLKRCGVCNDSYRSTSALVDHQRREHEFEKCLTCISCNEIFPNPATFAMHRHMNHADVNQSRCENCDIYFTYVEFKQHEKECLTSSSAWMFRAVSADRQVLVVPKVEAHNQALNLAIPFNTEECKDEESPTGSSSKLLKEFLVSDKSIKEQELSMELTKGQKFKDWRATVAKMKILKDQGIVPEVDSDGTSSEASAENSLHTQNGKNGQKSPVVEVEQRNCDQHDTQSSSGSDVENGSPDANASRSQFLDYSQEVANLSSPGSASLASSTDTPYGKNSFIPGSRPKITENMSSLYQGPFGCQMCFDVFGNFDSYEQHCQDIHARYVCPQCASSFANRRNLMRHMRKHTGDRPYSCNECNQKFYRDDELKRHKEKQHKDNLNENAEQEPSVAISCAYCLMPQESQDTLITHLVDSHGMDVAEVEEDLNSHMT